MAKREPVASYARMWPRELFSCKAGRTSIIRSIEILSKAGVYVLYRNDTPYYVGQAAKLRKRLWSHANRPGSKYYNFWNYFSVFAVDDPARRNQIESFLIAAMPTANGAKPKIRRAELPAKVRKVLHSNIYKTLPIED